MSLAHPHVNRLLMPRAWHRTLGAALARTPLLLTLFGLSLYLLTTGAYLDNPDARSAYSMTRGLVLRSSITIPTEERLDTLFEKVGQEGAIYSKYGLAQPLLQLPLFLAGRWVAPQNERLATETAVALLPAILTALTLPLLASLARMLFASERVALALALIYGAATMAWLYATLTYTEPLLTLLVLSIAWLLLRAERIPIRSRRFTLGLAGVLTGLAILTKYPAAIYVPALLWYAWRAGDRDRGALTIFAAPLLLGVLGLAAYDLWRFGDVLNTGYNIKELTRLPRPLWYGLYTLFCSVGKSVFIYAPPLLPALYALPCFVRQTGAFGRFVVLVLSCSVLFYALVNPWNGAWSPGPRYQLPLLPLALLPLGCLLARWDWLALWKRLALISTMLAGALVQLTAVSISYSDTLVVLQTVTSGQYAWGFWFFDPDYAPLIWQGRLLLSALARSFTGHTLLPQLSAIPSAAHPGAPLDQINCWFAYLPPNALVGRLIAAALLLAVVGLTYRIVWWFVRPPIDADASSLFLQHQEDSHATAQEI
jgi:dolichyl-phosphate-mannose-protein mannosyltransferase